MVFVVSHCFMGMFWERYFILLAVTTLRSKLGTNFVPQKFPSRNTTQHHSVLMRNHEMKKVGHHK